MKRIVMIAPFGGPVNGVKVLSNQIANYFAIEPGYKLNIIDTAQAKSPEDFGKFNFKKLFDLRRLLSKMRKISSDDFVYMNFSPSGFAFYRDYLLLNYVLRKTKNVTLHLHANGLEKKKHFFGNKKFNVLKCIVITQHQFDVLSFIKHRVLLPNALKDFYKNKIRLHKNTQQIQVLFFSNLSREKGTKRLFEFCQYCTKHKLPYKIFICGGVLDAYSKKLLQKIMELKNNNIQILNPIQSTRNKMQLFEKSHFLLFLSDPYYEVYPLVYIEALMNGVSIITTPQYVANEVVSENNGVLIADSKSAVQFIEQNKAGLNTLCSRNRFKFEAFYDFENYFKKLKNIIVNAH